MDSNTRVRLEAEPGCYVLSGTTVRLTRWPERYRSVRLQVYMPWEEAMSEVVIKLLSEQRVHRHRNPDESDAQALESYARYQDLRSSLLTPISHVEVMLRNALCERLTRRFGENWFTAAGLRGLLDDAQVDRLDEAIKLSTTGSGGAVPSSRVVTRLSMSFWRLLLARSYDRDLWIPTLRLAFVAGTTRAGIYERMDHINLMRNRVAHHRRLSEDPRVTVRDCQFVVNAISPHASAWFLQAVPERLRPAT